MIKRYFNLWLFDVAFHNKLKHQLKNNTWFLSSLFIEAPNIKQHVNANNVDVPSTIQEVLGFKTFLGKKIIHHGSHNSYFSIHSINQPIGRAFKCCMLYIGL